MVFPSCHVRVNAISSGAWNEGGVLIEIRSYLGGSESERYFGDNDGEIFDFLGAGLGIQ